MQVYVKATTLQRLAAFLIDLLLITFMATILTNVLLKIVPFDKDRYDELYELIMDVYKENPQDIVDEVGKSNLIEFFKLFAIQLLVNSLATLVLIILYLVLLPMYWDKQTIGRLVSNTKVIRHKGDVKCHWSNVLLREIVGTFLMYSILGSIGIIVTIVMVLVSRRSLADYIGMTDFVMFNPVTVDENGKVQFENKQNETIYNDNPKYDESIDAKVNDANDNNNDTNDNNKENESDDEDDYIVI